jgi:hypothetical protein
VRSASNSESDVDSVVDDDEVVLCCEFSTFVPRRTLAARRTVLATKKNATPKNFFFFFFFFQPFSVFNEIDFFFQFGHTLITTIIETMASQRNSRHSVGFCGGAEASPLIVFSIDEQLANQIISYRHYADSTCTIVKKKTVDCFVCAF